MDKWITKRSVLLLGIIGATWCAFLLLQEQISLIEASCRVQDNIVCANSFSYLKQVIDAVASIGLLAFLLPFSFITYFLHERIFKAWAYFAIVWVPILIFLPNFFDSSNGNFGLSDAAGALFLLTVGYVFFSILIILIQSIRVYWLKK